MWRDMFTLIPARLFYFKTGKNQDHNNSPQIKNKATDSISVIFLKKFGYGTLQKMVPSFSP